MIPLRTGNHNRLSCLPFIMTAILLLVCAVLLMQAAGGEVEVSMDPLQLPEGRGGDIDLTVVSDHTEDLEIRVFRGREDHGGELLLRENLSVTGGDPVTLGFGMNPWIGENHLFISLNGTRSGDGLAHAVITGTLDHDDVLLILNNNSDASREIGDHFLRFYDPHVLLLDAPVRETISRAEFDDIRDDIEAFLLENDLSDRINYMVTTTGLPLRVSGDGNAAFDSELTLILGRYASDIGGSGYRFNPFHNSTERFSRAVYDIYLVTRITGYSVEDALGIIDRSVSAFTMAGIEDLAGGTTVLDVAPGRDQGGYRVGNDWLRAAASIQGAKGYDVYLDTTTTFVSHRENVSFYASWGSNDANHLVVHGTNTGMETDSNGDDIPDGWIFRYEEGDRDRDGEGNGDGGVDRDGGRGEEDRNGDGDGEMARTGEDRRGGSWSVRIVRDGEQGSSSLLQRFDPEPGYRYYLQGYANVSGVTDSGGSGEPGGVRLVILHYDAGDRLIHEAAGIFLKGTTSGWVLLGTCHLEPVAGTEYVLFGATMTNARGTAYLDDIRLVEVVPDHSYLNGSLAETFVSTSARSFAYPTAYGQSLIADLIRSGVTGVKGYCYEPYLDAIAHPDILFDRYTSGWDLAESYYAASIKLSWMDVVVGVPKLAPFALLPDPAIMDLTLVESPNDPLNRTILVTVANPGGSLSEDWDLTLSVSNGTHVWNITMVRSEHGSPGSKGSSRSADPSCSSRSSDPSCSSRSSDPSCSSRSSDPSCSSRSSDSSCSSRSSDSSCSSRSTDHSCSLRSSNPLLYPGESIILGGTWEAPAPGTYHITVHLSTRGFQQKTANDRMESSFRILSLPDLSITDHRLIPGVPHGNTSFMLDITLSNTGESPATGVNISLYSGAGYVASLVLDVGGLENAFGTFYDLLLPPGWYTFLIVADPAGDIRESNWTNNERPFTARINDPPVAVITVLEGLAGLDPGPFTARVGREIRLSGNGSTDSDGTIVRYLWTIRETPDRYHDEEMTHVFDTRETFVVELTITDDHGASSSVEVEVVVENTPPVARFPPLPGGLLTFQEILFDGRASYDNDSAIMSYRWDFGDGAGSDRALVTRSYSVPGNHTVTLTVEDDAGAMSSLSRTVLIGNRPPVVTASISHVADDGTNVTEVLAGVDGGAEAVIMCPTHTTIIMDVGDSHDPDGFIRTFLVTAGPYLPDPPGQRGQEEQPDRTDQQHDLDGTDQQSHPDGTDQQGHPDGTDQQGHPDEPDTQVPLAPPVLSVSMDFRDPDQRAVIHLSPVSGTQRVVITLIDDLGAATAITFMLVFVNPPPVADFSFHPGEPATLEDVNFMSRARDNGVIVSHRWEVEDAEYHTPHMVHTFSTPGLHPITLTVTDDEGLRGIWYHWVLVANRPPVLTMERMRVVAGREVSLTVQASDPDGWIVRYLMELPSGEVLNRSSPTFTVAFPEGGVYHLNITVVDDHGAVASGVMEVHVLRKEGGSALPFPGAASLVLSLGAGLLMASFRRRASGNSRTGTVVRTTGHTRTFGTIRENAHQEHQNLRDHQSHREH